MGSTPLTLADVPNILIMMAALIALFIMLVKFLRNMEIVAETSQGDWRAAFHPPRLLMQRVHIPFTFKLVENRPVTYQSVECIVSSTVRYWHCSWWGAPVRELHRELWRPLAEVLARREFTPCGPHEERGLQLSSDRQLQLGAPPRGRYPLVVVLARHDADTAALAPADTVALITVIHIKDDECPLPSGIIAQYLKQANGHLTCLKQLYVSAEVSSSAACCVCASRPLSRALLPCRHACLCEHCLAKLDKCPMCRSAIDSYFSIRSEEEHREMKRSPFRRSLLGLFHVH